MKFKFMKVKIKRLYPDVLTPAYTYEGDAAFDLYSREDYELKSCERRVFYTGLALEIPFGYVGLIWDRSGLAAKNGLTNLGGVIDCGYRGEVAVTIYNTGSQPCLIKKGERIAQMIIQKAEKCEFEEAEELSVSERGVKGFGSSGRA